MDLVLVYQVLPDGTHISLKTRKRKNRIPGRVRKALVEKFGPFPECWYCGLPIQEVTLEHIIPASQQGHHYPPNIVPAHFDCNQLARDELFCAKWRLRQKLRLACSVEL